MLGVFRQDTNQGTDSQDAERRENREGEHARRQKGH